MTREHSTDVCGEVADGFAPVLKVFTTGASDFAPGGGALAVYIEGEKVVDLWAGEGKPGVKWTRDTLAILMSATKAMTALCAQILYDRGELDLDARVASYWPEFGQAGKERATVRQVLSHTVGLLTFANPGRLLDWEGRGWDQYGEIARRLAVAPPMWEPGTAIGYHAVSFGWLVGELVGRITGKTIGEFFHDQVARPLGADVRIGTPPGEQSRLADVLPVSYDGAPADAVALDRFMHDEARRPGSALEQAFISMHGTNIREHLVPFMNHPRVRAVEIAAGNGSATARGLAKVYAMLSMGGELSGTSIVSSDSIRVFSTQEASGDQFGISTFRRPDGSIVPFRWDFALGYAPNVASFGEPPLFGPSPSAFGHAGAGGQIGFCDPAHRIAVAYVRNRLTIDTAFSTTLISTVYDCLRLTRKRA